EILNYQRSLSARYENARRGELVVALPVGFVKVGDRLEKDPDRRVQQAITLGCDKGAQLGRARQALLWFRQHRAAPRRRTAQTGVLGRLSAVFGPRGASGGKVET